MQTSRLTFGATTRIESANWLNCVGRIETPTRQAVDNSCGRVGGQMERLMTWRMVRRRNSLRDSPLYYLCIHVGSEEEEEDVIPSRPFHSTGSTHDRAQKFFSHNFTSGMQNSSAHCRSIDRVLAGEWECECDWSDRYIRRNGLKAAWSNREININYLHVWLKFIRCLGDLSPRRGITKHK